MGSYLESFFVFLGFEVETEKIEEWNEIIHEAESLAAGLGVALIATSAAVFAFVNEMAEHVAELKEFADVNELSIENLQEMGYAASVSGSSLDQMKSAMAGLNMMIGQAASGIGRGAKFFQRFGLSAKDAAGEIKKPGDVFLELADKIKGMPNPEALNMLRRLGVDPSMILLMRKGRDGISELMEEARKYGVVSDEDAERSVKVKEAWTKLRYIGLQLGNAIAMQLVPGVLKIVEGFSHWIVASKDLIATRVITMVKALNIVIAALWDYASLIVSTVWHVVSAFVNWKIVGYAVAAALASIATFGFISFLGDAYMAVMKLAWAMLKFDVATSITPLLLGAMALAIFLLYDELRNFREGNDSVIGQLQKKYPWAIQAAVWATELLSLALVALAWNTVRTFALTTLGVLKTAAVWIPTMIEMSLAAIGVEAPIWLIVIALAAAGLAVWMLWSHWKQVTDNMSAAILDVTTHLENLLTLMQNVWNFGLGKESIFRWGDTTGSAGGDLGQTLANFSPGTNLGAALGSPLGYAGDAAALSSRTDTRTTNAPVTVNAPITINSNDPDAAGQAAADHVSKLSRTSIRNAQTQVSH